MTLVNKKLVKEIYEKELLLDKFINSVTFHYTKVLEVTIGIEGSKMLTLNCNGVKEFSIFDSSTKALTDSYLITHFKVFSVDDWFYVCFDPVSELNKEIDENDNFYFICSGISANIP